MKKNRNMCTNLRIDNNVKNIIYICVCVRVYIYTYRYTYEGYRGGCEVVGELEAAHASFQASTWGSRGWGSTSSRRILRTMQVGEGEEQTNVHALHSVV